MHGYSIASAAFKWIKRFGLITAAAWALPPYWNGVPNNLGAADVAVQLIFTLPIMVFMSLPYVAAHYLRRWLALDAVSLWFLTACLLGYVGFSNAAIYEWLFHEPVVAQANWVLLWAPSVGIGAVPIVGIVLGFIRIAQGPPIADGD
jgi:hypothetical protein